MLLKTVLHTGTSGGIADLRCENTNTPFQPKQEAINYISPVGTLIWDSKQT